MTRRRTLDRTAELAAAAASHPVYTVEQLGPNRRLLPNGNLLCTNVPIARVGWLIYGPGEVPVKPGQNGVAYVERTADSLFSDTTIGSFVGAAVCDDHPPVDVDPTNYEKYASGFVLSARRGTGEDSDVLLGDLVITRKSTIDAILNGKVEVSAGYDADYVDRGGGAGLQSNLIGNHVALVEKGRCGPRCAIGDQAFSPSPTSGANMPQIKHHGARRATIDEAGLQALRQRAQDAVAELAAAESGTTGDDDQQIHIHVHGGDQEGAGARTTDAATQDRIAALEDGMEAMQETLGEILAAVRTSDAKAEPTSSSNTTPDDPGTGNTAKKNRKFVKGKKPEGTQDGDMEEEDDEDDGANAGTRDSAALHTSYTEMMSQAEVLVPGFKVPTFDAAATRATTIDRMCTSRRLCLSQFATTDSGAVLLKGLNGGKDADIVSMDCAAVAGMFKSASAAQAVLNNAKATAGAGAAAKTNDAANNTTPNGYKKPPTIQEQNEINRKFWEGK